MVHAVRMPHAHAGHGEVLTTDRTRRLVTAAVVPVVLLTLVGLVALWPQGAPEIDATLGGPAQLFDAKVVAIDRGPCQGTEPGADIRCALVDVRLQEGPDDGEVVTLPELSEAGGGLSPDLGDGVVVSYYANSASGFQYSLSDTQRRFPLFVLGAMFVVAVIALGRWGGVRALGGLVVSLFIVVQFILPAILEGRPPLLVAIVGSSAVAFAALYVTHGFNLSTTAALLGTIASLVLTGVLGTVFVGAANFTGLASEDATFLQISAGQVDMRGLLLAGFVIGTLGVLDDVTVTQVSAVWELRAANPAYRFADLYRSALRIGRDHIASTVNTLVLAYAGASLTLLLIFTQSRLDLADAANSEVVAVEVVRTLVGSIGLVASVPITTALAALIASRQGSEEAPGRDSWATADGASSRSDTPTTADAPAMHIRPPDLMTGSDRAAAAEPSRPSTQSKRRPSGDKEQQGAAHTRRPRITNDPRSFRSRGGEKFWQD